MKNFKEIFMKIVFLIAALASIGAVILICVFLFANGIPAIKEIGLFDFLLGDTWRPGNDLYGIWPMIVGQYLRYCRSYHRRGTNRRADRYLFGPFLPSAYLSNRQTCSLSYGGHSLYHLWLLWPGGNGAHYA